MRVLLVGPYIPSYFGIPVHVKRLKRKLMEKGISVELATYPESLGLTVNDLAEYRLWWPEIFKKTLHGNYTLVHVHAGNVNEEGILRAVAFKLSRAKLIVTFHSYRIPNSWKHKLAACLLLQPIDHIVCVNPAIRDRTLTYGFPAAKTSVISPYLPPPLLEQDRLAIAPDVWQFMASHRPLLTANAARLNWFQGQDLYGLDLCVQLCQALIKDYPKLGFVFALPLVGDEAYFAEITARIKAWNLENAFFFSHASAEYWPIIERSDLFLRPTNTDSFGMSVAEAIDLGTPTIASDVCSRSPGTILFQNRNFADLLAKTQEVLSHLDEHKKRLKGVSASQADPVSQILEVYRQVSTNWIGKRSKSCRDF